jgi:hypothetical protein
MAPNRRLACDLSNHIGVMPEKQQPQAEGELLPWENSWIGSSSDELKTPLA